MLISKQQYLDILEELDTVFDTDYLSDDLPGSSLCPTNESYVSSTKNLIIEAFIQEYEDVRFDHLRDYLAESRDLDVQWS